MEQHNRTPLQTEDSNSVTVDSAPKTWAKLVGGKQTTTVAVASQLQNMTQVTVQQPVKSSVTQNRTSISASNNANHPASYGEWWHVWYCGRDLVILVLTFKTLQRTIAGSTWVA